MLGVAAAGPLGPAAGSAEPLGERPPWSDPPGVHPAIQDDRAEREAWALLASVVELGPATMANLVGRIGNAREVIGLAASDPDGGDLLAAATFGARRDARTLLAPGAAAAIAEMARRPDRVLDAIGRLGLRVLLLGDADYPPRLIATELPPPALFLRGAASALDRPRAVAIVGTRRPTDRGRAGAIRLATDLSTAGATIVSGLAIGIDGAAHSAAVELGRPTVGVLGGGHDRLYPRAHRVLAEAMIAEGGAVLAEMGPLVHPTRWSFPRRNRVISGLADATVVIEAPARSGALDTAGWALEQGRGCFLVPGRTDDPEVAGSLDFLRRYGGQARVVASSASLLEDLGYIDPVPASRRERGPVRIADLGLSSVEARLADLIRPASATLDDLVAATSVPVATALGALTMLEMRGLVTSAYGRYRPTVRLAGASSGRPPPGIEPKRAPR